MPKTKLTIENIKCSNDFECFENFFDTVADYVLNKTVLLVSCQDFEVQGSLETITKLNNM